MLGHKKIQLSLLLSVFVIGCSSKDLKVASRRPYVGTPTIDSKIANAPMAPMPKILPQTHFAAARLFEEQGQLAKAMIQYKKAIAVNHKYVAAYHRMGMLLSKQGLHENAIQMFNTAVELQPNEAILRNNLGFELMFLEQWSQAKEHFTKAIEFNPKLIRAHINMGLVLSKLGEFDRALTSFSAVLPEADAYYNLGLMYRGQKRYEDAVKSFEHVLKCNPKFTAARMQLAELVVYLESPEEKFANKKFDVDVQPVAELPVKIDRVADLKDEQKKIENQNDNKVVMITLPTKEKQPSKKNKESESQKEEWENIFDDLANHYANVGGETIENTYQEKDEETQQGNTQRDVEKIEVALAIPMPRISEITPRRTQQALPHQDDQKFLQHNPKFDEKFEWEDSEREVVAMTGLSLDESEEKPAASANRPAVIPEALDWFRGKLSMVRNEIVCLEGSNNITDRMEKDSFSKPVKTKKYSTTNRSVLVNDEKTKSIAKKSKPITDASAPGMNQLIGLFNAGSADLPFEEFMGIFKYLFSQVETVPDLPVRDLDELMSIVNNELDCMENKNPTRLAETTKSPQDETREWMLQEFGPSANWLLQPEKIQTTEAEKDQAIEATPLQADESEQEKTPTTIEKIIRSAKLLVMGMTTP